MVARIVNYKTVMQNRVRASYELFSVLFKLSSFIFKRLYLSDSGIYFMAYILCSFVIIPKTEQGYRDAKTVKAFSSYFIEEKFTKL